MKEILGNKIQIRSKFFIIPNPFADLPKKSLKGPLIGIAVGIAISIRILFFSFTSIDLEEYLIPWFQIILNHGGFLALKDPFYNYSPPYMYFLAMVSAFGQFVPANLCIKLISVGFDFLAAWVAYLIARLKFTKGSLPWVAFFAVLLSPTVVIDSAYWGQCDSIYCSFLLGCVYFCCIRRYKLALICFSSAFSFKAQAIFIAPLIALLFLKKMIPWRQFLLMPAIYLLWLTPALVVGLPFSSAVATYVNQANTYHYLSMNAPNLYVFIPNEYYDFWVPIGLATTATLFGFLIWFMARKSIQFTTQTTIFFSFLCALLAPFFLPKMHERYFYLAVLLSIFLPFYSPRLRVVTWVLQVTTFVCFTIILKDTVVLPIELMALANAVMVGFTLIYFIRDHRSKEVGLISY